MEICQHRIYFSVDGEKGNNNKDKIKIINLFIGHV